MLAWLYYGRSYECMVEQGEELAKRKSITRLYKWLVSYMVRFIIKKSISSGMRTKEDWVAFRKQQKAIEENNLVEWSIEDEEDIEETETDIARLYIALVEYRFMRPCPIKTFRNALQQQYTDLSIVHERGIQKAYRNLTTPFGGSKKLIKDIGEDHVAIEELKAYLSA